MKGKLYQNVSSKQNEEAKTPGGDSTACAVL